MSRQDSLPTSNLIKSSSPTRSMKLHDAVLLVLPNVIQAYAYQEPLGKLTIFFSFFPRLYDNAPHCPKAFFSHRFMEMVMVPPDWFSILTFTVGPASPILSGPRQSPVAAACVAVGRVSGKVGRASGVKVGNGVGLGTSVGGTNVAVGMACCVAATIVQAAATAVFCTSTGAIVGGS